VPLRIVEAVAKANDNRKRAMGRKIIAAAGGDVRGKRIGLLGLAFKPNTDDMRDAPSLAIVQSLLDAGAIVTAHDPESMETARAMMPGISYVDDPYAVAHDAEAVAIVTEWNIYRALDLGRMAGLMRQPLLVDLRNVYNRPEVERHGMTYLGIGR
jgi:UDPglucose 6-dehydrogenase